MNCVIQIHSGDWSVNLQRQTELQVYNVEIPKKEKSAFLCSAVKIIKVLRNDQNRK